MKRTLYVLAFTGLTMVSTAQVENPFFSLTVSQDTYTPLANTTSLNQGIPYDDPEYDCPIGFSFDYLGNTYDSLIFGGIDGWGMECIFREDFPPTPDAVISPSMHDVIDGEYNNDGKADSDIRYALGGTPGNRIFKLEWSNVAFYNEGDPYSIRINNQMWLYEADHSIEFRYGPHTELDYDIILDYNGVPVAFTKDFNPDDYSWEESQALQGDPAGPEFISLADYDEFEVADFLTAAPSDGTVYRFVPLMVNVEEKVKSDLIAYPNPADEMFSVRRNGNEPAQYFLTDSFGKKVLEGNLTAEVQLINVSTLSAGMYFLAVKSSSQSEVIKVMIK